MCISEIAGQLVTFEASNGFMLDGILYRMKQNRATILHVHGSHGNFYANKFLRAMAKSYGNAGFNFLCFNLCSHDGIAEGFRSDGSFKYCGGALVPFETCIPDIEGAIRFANGFSDKIILQGHSLGCDRIVHYSLQQESSLHDLILLSPCDSRKLQETVLDGRTIDELSEDLRVIPSDTMSWEILPMNTYGVRQKGEDYFIPISRAALLSIINGPPFRLFSHENPAEYTLPQNVVAYIGGRDPLQSWPFAKMGNFLKSKFPHLTLIHEPSGAHDLDGCESDVICKIVEWLRSIDLPSRTDNR